MHDKRQANQRGSLAVMLLLVLVVALLAGAAYWYTRYYKQPAASSSSTAGSQSSQAVSLVVACAGLALSKGTSEGTAGTIYTHAVITNMGMHTCTLTGYPAAFMKDSASVSVGATSNALYTPVAVAIAPGGKAHAVVGLPDPGNFDPGSVTCTAAATSTLRLYLPGLATPIETLFGDSACPGFSVTALQPGA